MLEIAEREVIEASVESAEDVGRVAASLFTKACAHSCVLACLCLILHASVHVDEPASACGLSRLSMSWSWVKRAHECGGLRHRVGLSFVICVVLSGRGRLLAASFSSSRLCDGS